MTSLALSCSKPPVAQVTALAVDVVEGDDVLALKPDAVRELAEAQLKATKFVVLAEEAAPKEGVPQVRIQVAIGVQEPEATEQPEGHVRVRLNVKPKGTESFVVEISEREPATAAGVDGVQAAARGALTKALLNGLKETAALLTLPSKTDAELVALLKNPEVPENAVLRLLVERHNTAALAPLLARLEKIDPETAAQTMGLLVELNDARAVGPLIEISRRQNPLVQRAVIYALGSLGGDEAEGYLFAVSQGHDDEVLKAAATQALEEVRARNAREKK